MRFNKYLEHQYDKRVEDIFFLNQAAQIEEVLVRFGMTTSISTIADWSEIEVFTLTRAPSFHLETDHYFARRRASFSLPSKVLIGYTMKTNRNKVATAATI